MSQSSSERLAYVAWSRLAEPPDPLAVWLVETMGPVAALAWVASHPGPKQVAQLLHDGEADAAVAGGEQARGRQCALLASIERWAARLEVDPERDLRTMTRLGCRMVIPTDAEWLPGLDDLGANRPLCLWVRGQLSAERAIALVGARAASSYGTQIAADWAGELSQAGFAIASGGAFGIDAAAHRGALAAGGITYAFLACGLDRPYPAGNAALLAAVVAQGGAWISEYAPGSVPHRHRFLHRNRLIAASAAAVIVVEAAWRSGALNTVNHAQELLRPVGVVPGPVTSAASSGCHRILREGSGTCVTDAQEAAELAGPIAADRQHAELGDGGGLEPSRTQLGEDAFRLWAVLSHRRSRTGAELALTASLTASQTLAGLGKLELLGLARRAGQGWLRTNPAVSAAL